MLREFLPETLVLPRNALGRNGNPASDKALEIPMLREVHLDYEKKFEDLRNEKEAKLKKLSYYWQEVDKFLTGDYETNTRIGKRTITEKHQKCIIAHCPGFAVNLRRHLAQSHKILSRDEQDELMRKFYGNNFVPKK